MRPKTKLFAVEFRRILEVLVLQGLWKKFWAHYHDLFVQKWNCLPWIQTHFGSFLPPRFTEKVLDKYSRFMCPETTLFAVKFTHIWKLSVCNFYRKFWAQFHNLCVQKRSCWLCNSDAFGKVSACKIGKKVVGAFSRFVCRANKHSWLQHFLKMLWPCSIILHAHKSLLGCSGTLWSSWLSHFIRMLWIWTHLDCVCTHKLWRSGVTSCEVLSRKSWTGTSDMFWNI